MRDFTEFETWLEESGSSRRIGEMASEAVMEYIRAGKAGSLSAEQQEVVFNLSIRVASQVSAGLLREYHAFVNGQEKL